MGIYRSKENIDTLSDLVAENTSAIAAIPPVPNITSSTSQPTGGNNGDIWFVYS